MTHLDFDLHLVRDHVVGGSNLFCPTVLSLKSKMTQAAFIASSFCSILKYIRYCLVTAHEEDPAWDFIHPRYADLGAFDPQIGCWRKALAPALNLNFDLSAS
jgi:hypothetical protein